MTDGPGWRKSGHSAYNGDCAEIAAWRVNSHGGSGTAAVGIRDSKLAKSPVLTFTPHAWTRFTAQIREAS